MRVLVTGAGGQVGRALSASVPEGIEVMAADRERIDIADGAQVETAVADARPELIVNAAAFTAVDRAESEPELAAAVNAAGPAHLAAAAARHGARLIQLSTDFVFDGASSAPYAPNSSPAPLGVYGESKLAGERAVLDALPGNALVLRTAWVYAAAGRNFLLTMLRLLREREPVRVVADQIGSPTAADSIAGAVWALAGRPKLSGIWHWTDAGVASWYDFAVAIAEEAAAAGLIEQPAEVTPIASEDYPTPARRPRFSMLDWRATADAIGITPPHWRASLRHVISEIVHAE